MPASDDESQRQQMSRLLADWSKEAPAARVHRILVDHARDRARDKRGGGVVFTALEDEQVAAPSPIDALPLDGALDRLAVIDPLHGRIVKLRDFAGVTIEETSEALRISPATVKREWTWARAWLYHQLGEP